MSSLYADIGGPNSVVAIKMAVRIPACSRRAEDRRPQRRSSEQAGRRRQHRRQWLDSDKVDAIADTPNLRRRTGGEQSRSREERGAAQLRRRHPDLTGKACTPNTVSFAYDTYMLANGNRQGG